MKSVVSSIFTTLVLIALLYAFIKMQQAQGYEQQTYDNMRKINSSSIEHKGQKQDFWKSAGDSAAVAGKIYTLINAIIGTIIAVLIMMPLSIWMLNKKDIHTEKTKGKILNDPQCSTDQNNATTCTIDLSYTIDGKEYIKRSYQAKMGGLSKNQEVTVFYNPNDPNDIELNTIPYKLIGAIMLIVAIIIVISSWMWYYATTKSKFIAQATTVGVVAGEAKQLFN